MTGAPPPKIDIEIAAPEAARTFDRRVFNMVHGLPHSPRSDRYIGALSDLGEGLGWVVAAIGVAAVGGRKGRRAGIATAMAALGTSYLVQTLVKPAFRRRRPFIDTEVLVVGLKPTDTSFPSGHTAASFAAATALARFYPRAAPIVYGLATAVGISRMHLGMHFPSDVAVGAALGTAIGAGTAGLLRPRP